MEIKVDKFAHGFAWLVVKDGHLVDQGFDPDLKEARRQADAAALLYATHEYEAD